MLACRVSPYANATCLRDGYGYLNIETSITHSTTFADAHSHSGGGYSNYRANVYLGMC